MEKSSLFEENNYTYTTQGGPANSINTSAFTQIEHSHNGNQDANLKSIIELMHFIL